MAGPPYVIGIDLGTSNCAMAFVEPARGADAPVNDFRVAQLEAPGKTVELPLLPSFLYLPGADELPTGSTRLPWGDEPEVVTGEFARWQGARVPGRLVTSAKSWLCHSAVDRTAPILPWGAPGERNKLSPVDASARLLAHMAAAWDAAHPDAPLGKQEVIVTVPASFDEVARALTVSAARQARYESFTLLEEPQAAFYDFTARHRHDLAAALEGIRLILVIDVGGGTSDFTLVQVGVSDEGPLLRRIAVGEHLMLGGDNMDAALARHAEQRLLADGRKLTATQWSQLLQAARVAKETLLADTPGEQSQSGKPAIPDHYRLAVVAEGSRLVGRTLSTSVTRAETERLVLDGFFPACGSMDAPHRASKTALQEMGLPYAQDAAVTRHLAAFLRTHAQAGFAALGEPANASVIPRPDAILLNGGVFNSPRISGRLLEVLSGWWPQSPPIRVLQHSSLELAVARGAAFYGLVRRGLGQRISGGAAHGLYVGLENPGAVAPLALCVVPRGQEEGQPVDLGGRVFQLLLGRPVRFPLYSTASDRLEKAGDVVPLDPDMKPLAPIHTVLKGKLKGDTVPVHLNALLTEVGTLELWCVSNLSKDRWRLEFELRGEAAEPEVSVTQASVPSMAEARLAVDAAYGKGGGDRKPPQAPKDAQLRAAKQLWASLEKLLGPREEWRLPVLRELWSVVFSGAARRRRSAEHERVFFQLLGYTLRPGFGYALDEWRCEQAARLFTDGIEFHKETPGWKEFWIAWRRIAGGLTEARHQEIWLYLKPHLALLVPPRPPKNAARPKGVVPQGLDEMLRLAAALEHLDGTEKAQLGDWIAARLREGAPGSGPWMWALGRLGARAPIYGSIHKVVPVDKASEWLGLLLKPEQSRVEGALFASAQMARLTGDRARDLQPTLRQKVLETLMAADASPSWQHMVSEVVPLAAADKARALGDTLPLGLTLG